jgi:hypothetical protein
MEARRDGGVKEAQQWTEGSETNAKKISKNWIEEAGDEEKGREALGLGTSSKLLEPGVKGTWEGGMTAVTVF